MLSAWGSLTFDPNKDDIEQFILKVEELAKKLGYNEDAQVMAVKSVLPRDVYGICMTYKTLKELKTFLIDLFANPKMREAVPGTASVSGEPGVFSNGQHVENKVVNPTIADVSKIRQDMNALQVRFNKISSADFRNKTSKPWKPEVTPPKRRGGFNRGRGGRQYEMPTEMTDSRMRMMVKIETLTREIILEISEIEGKVEEDLKVILEVKVEAEVNLIKVPM